MQITDTKSLRASLGAQCLPFFLCKFSTRNWQVSQVLVVATSFAYLWNEHWVALWQGQHNILIGICISSSMQLPTLFHICPHFPTHFPHFGFQVEPQKDPYAAAAIVAIARPYIAVVYSTYVSLYIRIVIAAYECGRQRRRGHLICSCMKMCSHCTHKSGN